MISSIELIKLQEIHDTTRAKSREIAEASRAPEADWQAMWAQRGHRLMQLAADLEDMTRQRDMLATRCAEQAKHIAGLISLQAEEAAEAESHPLADAIAVMQRAGIR